MKRILFVDDEPLVLGGLRDMLRRQRKDWDMAFALGGEAALEELSRGHFDVVVSDMRMPGIDGVSLLRTVMERHPISVRIILSGHAERDAVLSALPVAHQFLSKPCATEVLRDVVERACALKTMLPNETIRTAIGGVYQLSSAPRLHEALTQAASRPDVSLDELSAIIERDPALAAKVLQLVSSSFFGLAHGNASIWEAVSYLGTELLKQLTLDTGIFGTSEPSAVEGFSLDENQRHAALSAAIAERLVAKPQRSEAFAAALVHDIGKVVLAQTLPERYGAAIKEARETGRLPRDVEKELLEVTHAEVGAYLLALWGIAPNIVTAVAFHNDPASAPASDLALIVHVASALSHSCADDTSDSSIGGRLDIDYLAASPRAPELAGWRQIGEAERQRQRREV